MVPLENVPVPTDYLERASKPQQRFCYVAIDRPSSTRRSRSPIQNLAKFEIGVLSMNVWEFTTLVRSIY